MTPGIAHTAPGGLAPVWWEPLLIDGADWTWSASIHGEHTITAGELIMDGRRWPAEVTARTISLRVPAADHQHIGDHAAATLYLDLADGTRIAWIHGRTTRGEAA